MKVETTWGAIISKSHMATKPIHFSHHARRRMDLRGATEAEVIESIQSEKWQPALQEKWQVRKKFDFGKPSPVNQQVYSFKTIHAIFAEETDSIVVVTVIVYYTNEEQAK